MHEALIVFAFALGAVVGVVACAIGAQMAFRLQQGRPPVQLPALPRLSLARAVQRDEEDGGDEPADVGKAREEADRWPHIRQPKKGDSK